MAEIVRVMNFFTSFKGVLMVIVFFGVCLLLKQIMKRRKYSKAMPGMIISLVEFLGVRGLPVTNSPLTALIWQIITAVCQIFKKERLFCVYAGFSPFIVLNKPEAIEEVLNGTKINEKAWLYDWLHCWLGRGLLTSYGQKWKLRRKLLTPAFHFDILKDFIPVINEKSMLLVRILEKEVDEEYTDVLPPITLCSLDIICETTLGINLNCQNNKDSEYVQAVEKVSDGITKRITNVLSWFDLTYFLTNEGRQIRKDLNLLHKFTMSVINEKKKNMQIGGSGENIKKRKPLMDLLLQHHIETKELSEEDIREEVDTFTFEGHETTALAIAWSLYFIGLYKDVQAKLHAELDEVFGDDKEREISAEDLKYLKYLECVLKESLRLSPSVPLTGRKADRNMTICGYPIPKGASLFIIPYLVHRDDEIYPNPEVFDPSRFITENSINRHPYAYIPFLAGPRNCIGQRFAMVEEKIVVANILRNYIVESLDPRDKVTYSFELVLKPVGGIRIKLKRR